MEAIKKNRIVEATDYIRDPRRYEKLIVRRGSKEKVEMNRWWRMSGGDVSRRVRVSRWWCELIRKRGPIRKFRLEYAPERLVNWKFKRRRENLPTLLNQLSLPRVLELEVGGKASLFSPLFSINWQEINFDIQILVLSIVPSTRNERNIVEKICNLLLIHPPTLTPFTD